MGDLLAQVDEWEPDTVAVGVTDPAGVVDTHGPVDEVLPLASVTKLLSASAVLIAVQDGLVHLDEPTSPRGSGGITVRHLLAHASGLPPDRDGPVTAPERRRIYSNWGFELLGELVADRVGVPFAAHLEVEVLDPLGMSDTALEGSPAHAAVGTVADLLRFGRELLAPTLLDADVLAEATSVAFPGLDGVLPGYGRQSPNDWGLGFELKDGKDPHWTGSALSPATFGHFGESGSFLWVDPERQLACATLADRSFGDWAKKAWPGLSDSVVASHA